MCGCCLWGGSTQVFSAALFIFRIGWSDPPLVMRTRVTVCLESWGNVVQPCPGITAEPHRPPHSHCLLRLHSDCKSRALLTHLCCLSPRLMAIASVCFSSGGEGGNYSTQTLFWKQAKWKHWQLMGGWQPPLRGITRCWSFSQVQRGDCTGFKRNVDGLSRSLDVFTLLGNVWRVERKHDVWENDFTDSDMSPHVVPLLWGLVISSHIPKNSMLRFFGDSELALVWVWDLSRVWTLTSHYVHWSYKAD